MIRITSKEPVRAFLNELIGYFRTQERGIRFMENGYDLIFMDWQGCGDGYGYSWLEPTYYTRKCQTCRTILYDMTTKLKEWLRMQWKYSNHAKYQHYFEEWVENILPYQIEGFEKQMFNLENHVLGK